MSSPSEACQLAINLAKNCGWHTFPCRLIELPNGKVDKPPCTSHGFQDASNDPCVIRELWRKYPGPLVGIRTGQTSGISVVDVDVKLNEGLWWWKDSHHRLLPTRCYETRSGGLHLYFQHLPGITNTQGKLCAGVDTRGEGGFVVSWWCDGYGCFDYCQPAPWPTWLLTELIRRAEPPPQSSAGIPTKRALAGIVRRLEEARDGERNSILYWAACRFAERGISQAEAEALLLPAVPQPNDPKKDRGTIASVFRGRVAA
jgi:Bifunctional DNA primase/polymerase, N-terminal